MDPILGSMTRIFSILLSYTNNVCYLKNSFYQFLYPYVLIYILIAKSEGCDSSLGFSYIK